MWIVKNFDSQIKWTLKVIFIDRQQQQEKTHDLFLFLFYKGNQKIILRKQV